MTILESEDVVAEVEGLKEVFKVILIAGNLENGIESEEEDKGSVIISLINPQAMQLIKLLTTTQSTHPN